MAGLSDDDSPGVRNIASGQLSGSVLQAGAVHGDVYLNGGADRQVVPRQLLPQVENFIGRRRELAALDGMLASSFTVVLLKGPGGVGKTALAVRWLGQLTERFPGGQLYADLTGGNSSPLAPEDVLGQFLPALGTHPQRVPTGLAERAALFRSVTAQRPLAMLLDSAFSAAQVRALLPASAGSLVVVTSRRPLLGLVAGGAHVMPVEPLDPDSSLDLLRSRVGPEQVDAERQQATNVVRLCGGLPIALCVAAALTLSRPRRSFARTAAELGEEHRRLEMLSVDDDMSVRAAFDASYAELSDLAARVYRALALSPGLVYGVELVAAATDIDGESARVAVNELVDASLLEELDDNSYRFHDLIRVHAHDQARHEDSHETRMAVLRRIVRWYQHVARLASHAVMPARLVLAAAPDENTVRFDVPAGMDSYDEALRWLERERRTLIAVVRTAAEAGWDNMAYQLANAMQPLFIVHKHLRDAVKVDEVALGAARAIGDPKAERDMENYLARAWVGLRDFVTAERHAKAMLERCLHSGDWRGVAHALKTEGIILVETGQLERAVEVFREVLALLREQGRTRAQGLVLIYLGEVLLRVGEFQAAAAHLEQAQTTLSQLNLPDRFNAARAAIVRGRAETRCGRYQTARALLDEAMSTMIELRSTFEQVRAHRALAELARQVGDDGVAERHEQAATELGSRPVRSELDWDG
jgi:tetratricopeptide (TPR) repeat protein